MFKKFLDKAYGPRDAVGTEKLYDKWADSYEAELGENGYVTPRRCAQALAKFSSDTSRPILDFGCGTGLSGDALNAEGFTLIDGVDISEEMLGHAGEKSIYRDLHKIDAGEALHHTPGKYAAIAAIGVIGAGAAPITVFDQLMQGLGKRGLLVFSFNDHALKDPKNEARVNEWLDCGAATLLFKEYGDHIPGINFKSNVYVIEKK